MKFLHILSLLLVALVAYTTAQRCPGRPRNPSCFGIRLDGRGGPRCTARNLWYFDPRARQCRPMRYLGCGGNRNRWCDRASCERGCRR
ncbi:amblin-like [Calliphora vicina]|uniref:amblin-like n=1 Tax=Calliphora vicina TaxID=7373 RepID=UPI00325BCF23